MTGGQAVQIARLEDRVAQRDVTIGKLDKQVLQLRVERDRIVGWAMDLEEAMLYLTRVQTIGELNASNVYLPEQVRSVLLRLNQRGRAE